MKEIQDERGWARIQEAIIALHLLAFAAFLFFLCGAVIDGIVQLCFLGDTPLDRVDDVLLKDGLGATYPIFSLLIPALILLLLVFQKSAAGRDDGYQDYLDYKEAFQRSLHRRP